MRYTKATEQQVKSLAKDGKSLEYISTVTGISKKVIWQWVPELRPHEDIIKQSVKQRYHFLYPDLEAKISTVFSPLIKESVTEDEWDNACKVIYDTLFEESLYVFKNVISDPPTFGEVKKLSDAKFLDYIKTFWDFEKSDYIAERNSDKQELSRKYVKECRNTVHYWSFLKNKLMRDVTKGDVEIIQEKLEEKKLSPSRIYFILKVGLTPLEYAYKNGLTLLKTYEYQLPKKNPVFTKSLDVSVISGIFGTEWKDKEAYIANLTACFGKLTLKETAELKLGDLYIDGGIRKGNVVKKVPNIVIDTVLKYVSMSPYKDFKPSDYVFYTIDRNRHSSGYKWNTALKEIASEYTDRQISFSVWSK